MKSLLFLVPSFLLKIQTLEVAVSAIQIREDQQNNSGQQRSLFSLANVFGEEPNDDGTKTKTDNNDHIDHHDNEKDKKDPASKSNDARSKDKKDSIKKASNDKSKHSEPKKNDSSTSSKSHDGTGTSIEITKKEAVTLIGEYKDKNHPEVPRKIEIFKAHDFYSLRISGKDSKSAKPFVITGDFADELFDIIEIPAGNATVLKNWLREKTPRAVFNFYPKTHDENTTALRAEFGNDLCELLFIEDGNVWKSIDESCKHEIHEAVVEEQIYQ